MIQSAGGGGALLLRWSDARGIWREKKKYGIIIKYDCIMGLERGGVGVKQIRNHRWRMLGIGCICALLCTGCIATANKGMEDSTVQERQTVEEAFAEVQQSMEESLSEEDLQAAREAAQQVQQAIEEGLNEKEIAALEQAVKEALAQAEREDG